jgi:hypothetical protein
MGKQFLFTSLEPKTPPMQWVPGTLTPGVKSLGREADYSLPPSAEVEHDGTIPPVPYIFAVLPN